MLKERLISSVASKKLYSKFCLGLQSYRAEKMQNRTDIKTKLYLIAFYRGEEWFTRNILTF